jgi:hypothetical protein
MDTPTSKCERLDLSFFLHAWPVGGSAGPCMHAVHACRRRAAPRCAHGARLQSTRECGHGAGDSGCGALDERRAVALVPHDSARVHSDQLAFHAAYATAVVAAAAARPGVCQQVAHPLAVDF